ncbi:hypothetical protein U3516DRAFT_822234 [Neocallimastix sp. 'constans']
MANCQLVIPNSSNSTEININGFGKTITFKALTYSYFEENRYSDLIDEFNKYSKDNNLDIYIQLNALSPKNSSLHTSDYASTVDLLLQKKSNKYDIYIYNFIFSQKYGPYLMDLKELLTEEEINQYNPKYLSSSYYDNKLVGIPLRLEYNILYYNELLLNKYQKEVPKTWDELIETAKFIINEESKINNTIIGYNGMCPDSETGTTSLFDFLYSFRNTVDSPFPEINSPELKNALVKLKQIKNEISNEELFSMSTINIYFDLFNDKSLFIKYVNREDDASVFNYKIDKSFKMGILPGNKENISGSSIWADNIGITNFISDEKKEKANIVMSYLTSKENQRKLILKFKSYSAITSLYKDEKICKEIDCHFFEKNQFFVRPTNNYSNYEQYSEQFRHYIYDYLFKNVDLDKTIKYIDDITKVHYVKISTEESSVGLIMTIIASILIFIIILYSIFLLYKNIIDYFIIYPVDFWFLSIFGIIIILTVCFVEIGKITVIKCFLKELLISIGFTFNTIPILYKLIIDYPNENKLFKWIINNRYKFLLCFMIIIIIFIINQNYQVENVIVRNGENFQILIKEINNVETQYEISALYPNIFIDTFYIIISYIKEYIKFNNCIYLFILNGGLHILFSISNWAFLIYLGTIMINTNGKNDKPKINVKDAKFSIKTSVYDNSKSKNESFTDNKEEYITNITSIQSTQI